MFMTAVCVFCLYFFMYQFVKQEVSLSNLYFYLE